MAKKAAATVGQASRLSPKSEKNETGNGRADLPVGQDAQQRVPTTKLKSSALLDTRVVYCGDNLEQLTKLPDGPCRTGQHWGSTREITPRATTSHCLHRISRGETREKRAFEDRHENTKAYPAIAGRPRCVQLARVLKKTGSYYYHCDWHANCGPCFLVHKFRHKRWGTFEEFGN
ncbi:MAG: hypothetical protein ABSC01_03990 [Verrucomicrobiota bacterium]|jgi:hypothetical protein